MVRAKLGNLIVLGLGEAATRGFSFLAFSYLGHILAPDDLGTYGSAMAVLMFGMLAIDQGFGIHGSRGIARCPDDTEELVRRIVSAQVWIATVVYALVWLATVILPLDAALSSLIRGLGLTLFAAPFLLNWVFQGRNEMLWYALPNAVRQAAFLALVVLLVREPSQFLRLPAAEVGGAIIAALLFLIVMRRQRIRVSLDLRSAFAPGLFGEALPIGASNFIWALRTYLPILVVLGILGKYSAGLFEAGHRILMVLVAVVSVYYTNVFPAMSASARHAFGEFRHIVRRSLVTSVCGCLVMTFGVYLTSRWLISTILDPVYATEEAVAAMNLLSWILPLFAARRCVHAALIALDRQRAELVCSLVGLGLLLLLIGPFTSQWGLRGCVTAILLSEAAGTFLSWWAYLRNLVHLRDNPKEWAS